MLGNLMPWLILTVVLGTAIVLYLGRARIKAFFGKSEKAKEDEEMFKVHLEARSQKKEVNWAETWPKALEVYKLFKQLSPNLQSSPAALNTLIRKSFPAVPVKESDAIARCFISAVYREVKRQLAQKARPSAAKKH